MDNGKHQDGPFRDQRLRLGALSLLWRRPHSQVQSPCSRAAWRDEYINVSCATLDQSPTARARL